METIKVEIACDKCDSCEKLTFSPTGEAKWCCFCGAKLGGETENVVVAELDAED